MNTRRPPRVARFFVSRLLPRDVRDDIAGDLEERFRREHADMGALRAHVRYLRRAISFPVHFAVASIRENRMSRRTPVTALDLKLGARMLARYPGLTLVSTVGMAVGIAIATGAYSLFATMGRTDLPFDEGDRIVIIQNRDESKDQAEQRALYDFANWKRDASSVIDIGAFRHVERNFIETGRSPEPVRVAEMSAAGFRVTRVPPLMGRALVDEDERPETPPVAVVSEGFWREKLHTTPDVIGRSLQLGDIVYTIVGVMPSPYAFPVNDDVWIPFTLDPLGVAPRSGPTISVFGRLAPDVALKQAKAELAVLGEHASRSLPDTHARLRPNVMPFTHAFADLDDPSTRVEMMIIQAMLIVLLCIVCVNVSALVYARTATRQAEIAIRTSLGASRARIVGQLFVEALVLAGLAAGAGLLLAWVGLRQIGLVLPAVTGGALPFWMTFGLEPRVVLYAVGLAFLAASIVGVLPALKVTGRSVQSALRSASMGGGAGMQLGRLWTLLIVGQVAFTVALLPPELYAAWNAGSLALDKPSRETFEFATASLSLDSTDERPVDDIDALFATQHAELLRTLGEQPGVSDVTFSLVVPGQEGAMFLEIEGTNQPSERANYSLAEGSAIGHLARFNRVGVNFFETFDVALLAGRTFRPDDAAEAASTVVVNRPFVEQFFPEGNALGRRVRFVGRGGDTKKGQVQLDRWYEIVGVVADFPVTRLEAGTPTGRVYRAGAPGDVRPAVIAARMPGGVAPTFGDTMRLTVASVDPGLQVRNVQTLANAMIAERGMWRLIATVHIGLALAVVTLSAAGIYALMSFTVAQRRREIGVRSALGANPRRILTGIFARAALQVAMGAALGLVMAAVIEGTSDGELMQGNGAIVLPVVALFIALVALSAAAVPARRGLRIQPVEALRDS